MLQRGSTDTCQRQPIPTCSFGNLTWKDHCLKPSWDTALGSSTEGTSPEPCEEGTREGHGNTMKTLNDHYSYLAALLVTKERE